MHIVQYWQRVLWQRKWIIAGCLLSGVALAAAYLAVNPPVYEVQAELVFQNDPASASARGMSEQLLTSEAVLRATWESLPTADRELLQAGNASEAVVLLRDGLVLQSPRRSPQALQVSYRSTQSELVVPVLGKLVPAYLKLVNDLHASPQGAAAAASQSAVISEQTTADLQAIENIAQRIRTLELQIGEDTQQIVQLLAQVDARNEPTNLQAPEGLKQTNPPAEAHGLAMSPADKTRLEQLQKRVQLRRGLVYDLDWVRASLKNRVAQPLAAAAVGQPHIEVTRNPTQAVRVSASGQRVVAVCLVAAVLAAALAVFLLEQFDRRYRSPLMLEVDTQLPVLAVMPTVKTDPVKDLAPLAVSPATLAGCEGVEELRIALDAGTPPRLVTVTSPQRGEGASTVARSLAASFARSGQNTLLIETTVRYHGLQGAVVESGTWLDALRTTTQPRELLSGQVHQVAEHLHVLLSAAAAAPPLELLSSEGLAALLTTAGEVYDRVVLDTAACTAWADASVIGRLSDATVLVVAARRAEPTAVLAATERLRSFGVRLAGVVVNRATEAFWWHDTVGYTRGVWGTPRTGWSAVEARSALSLAPGTLERGATAAGTAAATAGTSTIPAKSAAAGPKPSGYAA